MEFSRESIFISSVRSFFNGLFVSIGIIAAFVTLAFIIAHVFMSSPEMGQVTLSVEPDAEWHQTLLPNSAPVLLVIDIQGPIMAPNLRAKDIQNLLLASREGVLKGDRVKGILLNVNTPGGTVTDANGIYALLKEYKKRYNCPIYSFTDGLCASGGIYVTSACDKNFASDVSIIGSVGVIIGPMFNYTGLMEKIGVQARTIFKGKDKQLIPAFEPWEPRQDESVVTIVSEEYDRFIEVATKARPRLDRMRLVNEYGAQIYAGPKAEELGFVDNGHATYWETLSALAKEAGIEKEYQVIRLKPKHSFFDFIHKPHPFEQVLTQLLSGDDAPQPLYLYREATLHP